MCALNDSHTHRSPQRPPSTSYTWEYKPRNPYNHFQVSRAETSTLPAAVSLPTFALNLNTVQLLDTRFWLSFSLQTSLPQTPPCIWSCMRLCTMWVVVEMINCLLQSWLQPAVQRCYVVTTLWRKQVPTFATTVTCASAASWQAQWGNKASILFSVLALLLHP